MHSKNKNFAWYSWYQNQAYQVHIHFQALSKQYLENIDEKMYYENVGFMLLPTLPSFHDCTPERWHSKQKAEVC